MKLSRFQASISQKGVLQNNRFRIQFSLPAYLRERSNGGQFVEEQATELVSLRCEAASLPGMNMTLMEQPRLGVGPLEFMPHNATLSEVQLTFLVDAFGDVHRLFYEWHNRLVNVGGSKGQSRLQGAEGSAYAPFEVGFKSDYRTDIEIFVYDKDNDTSPIINAKLYNAFPADLPAVPLSWNSTDELIRLTIPFRYTDFDIQYNKAGTSWKATDAVDSKAAAPALTSGEAATAFALATNPLTAPIVAGVALGAAIAPRVQELARDGINAVRDAFSTR